MGEGEAKGVYTTSNLASPPGPSLEPRATLATNFATGIATRPSPGGQEARCCGTRGSCWGTQGQAWDAVAPRKTRT